MSYYNLNIRIKEEDLKMISEAGQKLLKIDSAGDDRYNVSWIKFDPRMNNSIEWNEAFSIYTSNTESNNILTK